jgi:hypothetical protein
MRQHFRNVAKKDLVAKRQQENAQEALCKPASRPQTALIWIPVIPF